MVKNEHLFASFLARGWEANWDQHPAHEDALLEMALIEPRNHPYLKSVLHNMSCVIPNASLTIIHSKHNMHTINEIVHPHGINNVRTLPILPDNLSIAQYNTLLTSQELWHMFDAPKVLLFQLDSGIRFNNILRFMQYDFIGAPWNWLVANKPKVCVGNGGFSLRCRKSMVRIAQTNSFDGSRDVAEDVFFGSHLADDDKACIPSKQEAAMFSVEHVPYNNPMAFHKAYEFHDAATVAHWMSSNLAPPQKKTNMMIRDAWLECDTGLIIPSHSDLVSFLQLGISTDGLLIDAGTKLMHVNKEPCPDRCKHLKLLLVKDGLTQLAAIPLKRMVVVEAVRL